MSHLGETDRELAWASYMAVLSGRRAVMSITKNDLLSAVNSVDDWLESNALSFSDSLPEPAKSSLTDEQKNELLLFVVGKRHEVH